MSFGDNQNGRSDEVYSKSVRAGKRTYFFDVKSTRGKDLYLTVTESKKQTGNGGKVFYEKHKIFLYKEDFEKFTEGLEEVIEKINQLKESGEFCVDETAHSEEGDAQEVDEVNFEDL